MTLAAGTPIGKYIVRRKLAEGGMAEIYLATATGPEGFEKEVVIKRVRPHLAGDEGFVQMFISEARLASRLNHANLVQIFDFDKHEDTYYLAMEYVRGYSLWELRKRCRERGRVIPPVLVANIGSKVAAGLHYAHRLKVGGQALNLVHRDVTPHNVLLSFEGAVKLTDFGIAKAGDKLTQPGVLKGKFAYMSPEQARGDAVDARTDTFALGVVLWEMLTGGRLFDGDSEVAVLRAVQQSTISPPARLNPDVPEDLDAVVVRALARDPAERFQTAGEMDRALAQCVLRNARSVDDTDVGAFVRYAFDVPQTQMLPAIQDRPQQVSTGSSPVAEPAPPAAGAEVQVPSVREPTAVLPGTGSSSGRNRPVRTDAAEEALVSAPTLVLARDVEPGKEKAGAPPAAMPERSTAPLPSVASARGSGPVPTATTAGGEGSAPRPAAPVREARVMPAITSVPDTPRAGRMGWGRWAGLAVAGVAVLAGVAVMRRPAQPPASTPPVDSVASPAPAAPALGAPTPAAAAPVTAPAGATAPPEARDSTELPAPPAPPVAPPVAAPVAPDAGIPVVKGTLIVRATPYATLLLDGRKLGEVQGRASFSLPPGRYRLTFQHPSGSEDQEVTIEPNGKVTREFRLHNRR